MGLEKESGGGQTRRWKLRRRFPFIFKNGEVMQLAGRGRIVEEAQGFLHLRKQVKWIFLCAHVLSCAVIPRADDGTLRAGIVCETMNDSVRGGGVEPTAPMVERVRGGASEHADVIHANVELGVEVIAEGDVTQRGVNLLIVMFGNGILANGLDTFDKNLFERAHALGKLICVEGAVVLCPLREHELVGHAARESDVGVNVELVETHERGGDGGMSACAKHFGSGGLIRVAEAADLSVAPRLLRDPFSQVVEVGEVCGRPRVQMISFRRARAAHVNAEDGVAECGEKVASGVGQGEKPREGRFELLGAPIASGGKERGDFGFGSESAREVEVNGETSPVAHGDVKTLLGGAFV